MNTTCYVCGTGTGICSTCRKKYLGQDPEGAKPLEKEPAKPLVIHGTNARASFMLDTSSDDPYKDQKTAIDEAHAKGFHIIRSKKDWLLLDLDHGVDEYNAMIPMVVAKFGVRELQWWFSKSGAPHVHACVMLTKSLPDHARNALEVALGSDPRRAVFNALRIEKSEPDASVLFMPKNADVRFVVGGDFKIKLP